jgi:hypothetical protein
MEFACVCELLLGTGETECAEGDPDVESFDEIEAV